MVDAQSSAAGAAAVTKSSSRSVGDTVARFTGILEAHAIKVFAVIDQAAEARAAGLELRETTLVIFGNPLAGTPAMVAEPLVGLDLPLKVLVWADALGTMVSYLDPSALGRRYGLTDELTRPLAAIGALTDALVAP
jgi:uncharacterized protein (DUF302 family)